MNGFDQEILQDFLTESGELLEQLDKDLVLLEGAPRDPDLLNRVFRALHTIKGSASFLQLTNLVSVAHAAESALNAARNGQVVISKDAMDLLLAAVDVIKRQFDDLTAGRDLTRAADTLVSGLAAIGEGRSPDQPARRGSEQTAPEPGRPPGVAQASPVRRSPLVLSDNKLMLVEFLVSDLRETLAKVGVSIDALNDPGARAGAASELGEHADALLKHAQFFDFETMRTLSQSLFRVASGASQWGGRDADAPAPLGQLMPRLGAAVVLLREQADGLAESTLVTRPVEQLCAAIDALASGEDLPPDRRLAEHAGPGEALVLDACAIPGEFTLATPANGTTPAQAADPVGSAASSVMSDSSATPAVRGPASAPRELATPRDASSEATPAQDIGGPVASVAALASMAPTQTPLAATTSADLPAQGETPGAGVTSAAGANAVNAPPAGAQGGAAVEQTIRVEVGRLEALLNLVGELVLQKNRIAAIARSSVACGTGTQEFRDQFGLAAGQLDRVTSDIQVAVMRTRMQPLDKLFGKYPRLIRDLTRKTGKDINLVIEGGDTEVDKSVIEELGDPLVHIMRNSADHGIETPEERRGAGKPAQGRITLSARHEGSHVVIRIQDDGRGLSRARIARKAVERGIVSEQDAAKMSDREVHQIIFAAGFSTAEKVTDLSGRGVGMDVVRTNIEKIKGAIELESVEGQGTTIIIRIPLTVAILTAMMVGIGSETYAVPLASITEIVKPERSQVGSVNGHPVLRLRESVLPLLGGSDLFELPESKREPTPFAVICTVGDKRVGLQVSRLIGQQEVVIKPLDGLVEKAGPVSGATVRDDGGVSLIVDVAAVVKLGEQQAGQRKRSVLDAARRAGSESLAEHARSLQGKAA